MEVLSWDIMRGMIVGQAVDENGRFRVKASNAPDQRQLGRIEQHGRFDFRAYRHVPPTQEIALGTFADYEAAVKALLEAEEKASFEVMQELAFPAA